MPSAKEQHEFHTHLVECEVSRRFHRHTAISVTSATAPYQHSANSRDGNRMPLNLKGLRDEPDMTNRFPRCHNNNVRFRWSPLQLVHTGLAGIALSATQVASICRRIILHELNFDKFSWPERLRSLSTFRHVRLPKVGNDQGPSSALDVSSIGLALRCTLPVRISSPIDRLQV
jgi:hypothetical protein